MPLDRLFLDIVVCLAILCSMRYRLWNIAGLQSDIAIDISWNNQNNSI
jgi:hypothetical protein